MSLRTSLRPELGPEAQTATGAHSEREDLATGGWLPSARCEENQLQRSSKPKLHHWSGVWYVLWIHWSLIKPWKLTQKPFRASPSLLKTTLKPPPHAAFAILGLVKKEVNWCEPICIICISFAWFAKSVWLAISGPHTSKIVNQGSCLRLSDGSACVSAFPNLGMHQAVKELLPGTQGCCQAVVTGTLKLRPLRPLRPLKCCGTEWWKSVKDGLVWAFWQCYCLTRQVPHEDIHIYAGDGMW